MDKNKCDFFIQTIFDVLKKSELLDMEDQEMISNKNKIILISKEMYDFMSDNIASSEREILKQLISKRNDAVENAHSRENFLFYKNGFFDGMGVVLNAIKYM